MSMEFGFRRGYRGPLRAVILDWAGTTVDYGCFAPAVVFQEVYRRRGVKVTIEEARGPMGVHKKDHIRLVSQMESVAEQWSRAHGRRPNEEDVEAMYADFVPLQIACLARYADLIPGTLEAVADFRRRGLKIGATTGYSDDMMKVLHAEAARQGYVPDSSVCATQVPAGRPAPWMCFQNAMNLQVYPMLALVKIGDTLPDIAEGLNAGMWTIGITKTGNEMGLTEEEVASLDPEVRADRLSRASERMREAGAHFVAESIGEVPALLEEINARLRAG